MSRKKIDISKLKFDNIGDRVAFIRAKNDESQEVFGKCIGISKGNVSNLENHKYDPSYLSLNKIVEKYKVSPVWLLTGEGDPYIKLEVITKEQAEERKKEAAAGKGLDKVLAGLKEIFENQTNEIRTLKKEGEELRQRLAENEDRLVKTESALSELKSRYNKLAHEKVLVDLKNQIERRKGEDRRKKDEPIPPENERRSGQDRRKASVG